ncbi:MAG: hypothetical protein CL949_09965 [Erythrobacter sp.]|nr:hypothetical protein [Erythrobacter sp.]
MSEIPTQSLVVVTDEPSQAINALALKLNAPIVDWNIDRPEASAAEAHAALESARSVIVSCGRHHSKSLKLLASFARKRGLVSVLQANRDTPGSDKFGIVLETIQAVRIGPMPFDKRHDNGPFDIIGDVHGCAYELMELLHRLGHVADGWEATPSSIWHAWIQAHRTGRRVILLGDITDRGPMNLAALRIARAIERVGGYLVAGNHDDKLARWMQGRPVSIGKGLEVTVRELEVLPKDDLLVLSKWLSSRPRHLVLDGGQLVVAHAGLAEHLQDRATPEAIAFATYGKPSADAATTSEGYPEREDWALDYKGQPVVVHGHVVHSEPREINRVHAIDTGCVFGGKLTAFRWPEKTYEQVEAKMTYYHPRTGSQMR